MNNKESALHHMLEEVVSCCATQIDNLGTMSVSIEDITGRSRSENVVMTRCIFVMQMVDAGYSTTTIAQILNRTPHAIRHLQELAYNYMKTSRAFRIANAEATLKCKDIVC